MSEPHIPQYDFLPDKPRHRGGKRPNRPTRRAERTDPLRRGLLGRFRVLVRWRIGPGHLHFLSMQLRTYIESGYPIIEAWRLIAHSTQHLRLRRICLRIHQDLVDGLPMSRAIEKHDPLLPRFMIKMLVSAERSGAYGEVLRTLEVHYAWLLEIKSNILRAIAYPLGVLFLGKVVFVIRDFVLTGIHETGTGTLALPQQPALALGMLCLRHLGPSILAVVMAYWLTTIMRETPALRRAIDAIGLRIPGISGVIRRYSAANFCRMHATLSDTGQHPSMVYRDSAASMGNMMLEERIMRWQKFVDQGEPISLALRHAKVLPPDTLAVIETTEQTASSGDVLPRLADLMVTELRHQMQAMVRTITPLAPFLIAFAFFGPAIVARLGDVFILPQFISFWDILIFLFSFLFFLL